MPFGTAWMELKGIMPSEISHTERQEEPNLILYGIKTNKLRDTETRLVVARGGGWRYMKWVKMERCKHPAVKDVRYNTLTIVSHTACLKVAKRIYFKSSHRKKKTYLELHMVVNRCGDHLAIGQITNHYVVHLKLIQHYMSNTPQSKK